MNTAFAYFKQAAATHSPATIAAKLGLHNNTVLRWQEQGRAPKHYAPDLLRLLGRSGDATTRSMQDKDQYYTKPETAQFCVDRFQRTAQKLAVDLSTYHFIEPSAGDARFYELFPKNCRPTLFYILLGRK